jgi:surface antigen
MNVVKLGIVLISVSALSACVTGQKQTVLDTGLVRVPISGPVSGPNAGNATGREISKAFNGGILPKEDYNKLSRKDRIRALLAEYGALENSATGQSSSWATPNGNSSGVVTASQPYQVGEQNCRQYSHNAIIKGKSITATGAACRTLDGKWIPLS